jgi:hypothetical protein
MPTRLIFLDTQSILIYVVINYDEKISFDRNYATP